MTIQRFFDLVAVFVAFGVAALSVANVDAAEAEIVNELDVSCYVTTFNRHGLTNVRLDPGATSFARYEIGENGLPDLKYCRSAERSIGDCEGYISRGMAEGCFYVRERIGCFLDGSGEQVTDCGD